MSSPADSPVRPRRRWIWALVALLTATALVAPVVLRASLKGSLQHRTGPAAVYQRPVTALQIVAPGDAVQVTAGQSGELRLVDVESWLIVRPQVSTAWRGSTLVVRVTCPAPNLFEDCEATLQIQVPAGTSVQASAGTGDIGVTGLSGALRLAATSGSIALADVTGPVLARARHREASRRCTG